MKLSDKIGPEMQLRMLNKLIEIQTEQKERVKNEIAPKLNKAVFDRKNYDDTLSYVLVLRALQKNLNEMLNEPEQGQYEVRSMVKNSIEALGLSDDPFITALFQDVIDGQKGRVTSMNQLRDNF